MQQYRQFQPTAFDVKGLNADRFNVGAVDAHWRTEELAQCVLTARSIHNR